MRAEEFLRALDVYCPSPEELAADGLDADDIEAFRRMFQAPRKARPSTATPRSELERLVSEYDCSKVQVSFIQFGPAPEAHEAGVQIGYWEAEPIVVLPTGEVVAFDHAEPSYIAAKCAVDSEHFLDACVCLLEMSKARDSWQGRAREAARICVERAGGQTFRDFFGSLSHAVVGRE